ncbi:MAG: hypothetical protein QXI33_03295 [Candidatus Pacearchaeota archaeon]
MKINREVINWLDYELGIRQIENVDINSLNYDEEWKRQDLINWAETEQQRRDDKKFYDDARRYATGGWKEYALQKANILARHYTKFRPDGKQPLVDRNGNLSEEVLSKQRPEIYVGKIFHEVFEGVKKRIKNKQHA